MPRVNSLSAAALAFGASLSGAGVAQQTAGAQPQRNAIVARATEVDVSREVVEFVATNTDKTKFPAGSRPDLETRTPEAIARQLCGSVQPGYLEKVGLQPREVVGKKLYSVEWPACLYIAPPTATRPYRVRRGEAFSQIWERFTGSGLASQAIWSARLATANAPVANVKSIPERATLTPPLTTPTVMSSALSAADFKAGLASVQGGDKVTTAEAVAPGELILPVEGSVGAVANTGSDCVQSKVLDVAAIRAAYGIARDQADGVYNVRTIIVDNGFFGVDCTQAGCPASERYFSTAFPRQFFDRFLYDSNFGVGPTVLPRISPVNYLNFKPAGMPFAAADIDTTSGHGTHVAGLALGGEVFSDLRGELFKEAGKPWLKLTIFNVANGRRQLIPGSEDAIWNYLDGTAGTEFRIVNMSLVFNRDATPLLADNVTKALGQRDDILFVVAAGNEGADIDANAPLPASLGGLGGKGNIITVAAIDGNDDLASFSGWGEEVDVAAPGCKLLSRLNAEQKAVTASGTSQSAPIVAFAASLLRHVWRASPLELKKRLIYAGDPLACSFDATIGARCIGGGMKLNIWKALLIDYDVVTIGGVTYAGEFESTADFVCNGKPVPWAQLRSMRKVPGADGQFAIMYTRAAGEPLRKCRVTLSAAAGTVPFLFRQQSVWTGTGLAAEQSEKRPLSSDIEELVLRARKPNQDA